jgi:hypothetical protein
MVSLAGLRRPLMRGCSRWRRRSLGTLLARPQVLKFVHAAKAAFEAIAFVLLFLIFALGIVAL